jgi:hypothetical protein
VDRRRGPRAGQRYDLTMGAGALVSIVGTAASMTVIRSLGGFIVNPASPRFSTINGLAVNFWLKLHSLLVLFGADFFGISPGSAVVPITHLVAVALVVWAVVRAVRLVFTTDDLAMQIVTASFLALLAAFIFGYRTGARETVGLLPLGAVLASRMLATRVFEVRLVPILAAVLAFYGLSLARYDSEPALPSADRPLASWLLAHHLTYGMSTSWFGSNGVTLFAHDRVKAIDVRFAHNGNLVRLRWNTKASWYSPRLHDATFVVTNPCSSAIPTRLYTTVGPPSATYYVDGFSVLVWRHTNLLAHHPVLQAGTSRQGGQSGTRHHRHRNYASYQLMCG